jgi:peroxiredoxin
MTIPNVGSPMIDFNLSGLEGDGHKLEDFKGKYMLLEFWSLTCFSCMKAANVLKKMQETYHDKLHIIGLNMDTEHSMWEQGSRRDGITWHNLSDGKGTDDGIGLAYGIVGFPAYVMINPEGIIVDRWMGFKEGRLEEKVSVFIGE